MRSLFYIAVTGWTLGLIVHLLSLADIDLTDKVPFVWALHMGIFVVWIPAILYLRKNEELKSYQPSGMWNKWVGAGSMKIMLKQAPVWLSVIAIGGFIYALINFLLFMNTQPGVPDIKDGQYILQNHGQLIKTLTKQEYYHFRANEVRGFSGHWIAFYGMAAAILYPFKGKEVNQ